MALATQCPHCHTTFRVANDQLKLHAGIVRCGSCQQIFNGIEHLVAPDAVPAPAPAVSPPPPSPVPAQTGLPAQAAPEMAQDTTSVAAPPAADALDFDLGIFDGNPLPAPKKPAEAEARQEPAAGTQAAPATGGATTIAIDSSDTIDDDEDAERRQRLALMAAAEADWSLSDEGTAADMVKPVGKPLEEPLEEPPEDTPLTPDAEGFQSAAHAGLLSDEQHPEPAADAASGLESEFEPEFAPEFLSEFESVFEEEAGPNVEERQRADSISLAEADEELQTHAHASESGDTDRPIDMGTLGTDAEHVQDASNETKEELASAADIEAASIDPELPEEVVSSLSESEAPDFVVQAERRQARSKIVRITLAIFTVLLLFSLLAQATYTLRNQLAAWFPQARPTLANACKLLHCQITLLTQIDAVSIESNELQALSPDKNVFSLTLLLRNKGGTVQGWPMLELTLDNDKDQAVLRKVFTPAEYLANKNDLVKGFPAASEQPVKLYFELETIKAAGYHVWLFYP